MSITIHRPRRNHTINHTRAHRAGGTASHISRVVGRAGGSAGAAEARGADVVAGVEVFGAGVAELAFEEVVLPCFVRSGVGGCRWDVVGEGYGERDCGEVGLQVGELEGGCEAQEEGRWEEGEEAHCCRLRLAAMASVV